MKGVYDNKYHKNENMKKSGKSILYLSIVILIIVVIILIGIIINLLNTNKIEANEKIAKEQLEETPTNNAYITLEAHNSELKNKQQEIDNIQNIAGQTTATADKILKDYTAYKDGKLIAGTMANNGAVSQTLNAGGSYTIPAGYHNGSGKVTANSLASQTSANATTAQILSGQTAWVNGSKVTGSMVNRGAWTNTPTSSGKVTIPAGYHNGNGYVDTSSIQKSTYLGSISGGTFDAKSINGYKNLSSDNFILQIKSIPATLANTTCEWAGGYARGGLDKGFSLTKEYNSSTGTLTYTSTVRCYADTPNYNVQAYATITYDLYLVY